MRLLRLLRVGLTLQSSDICEIAGSQTRTFACVSDFDEIAKFPISTISTVTMNQTSSFDGRWSLENETLSDRISSKSGSGGERAGYDGSLGSDGGEGVDYGGLFNDVVENFKAGLETHRQPLNIVLISFYVPLFILALGGNMLVLLVVLGNKSMRSITNYFLLNLAFADLLGE